MNSTFQNMIGAPVVDGRTLDFTDESLLVDENFSNVEVSGSLINLHILNSTSTNVIKDTTI